MVRTRTRAAHSCCYTSTVTMVDSNLAQGIEKIVKDRLDRESYTEQEMSLLISSLVDFIGAFDDSKVGTIVTLLSDGGSRASLWLVAGEWSNDPALHPCWDELVKRRKIFDETRIGRCVKVSWAVERALEKAEFNTFGEMVIKGA